MREKNQVAKDRAAVRRLLERSGQSVAKFCREQGLPHGVVSRWRREARNGPGMAVEWVELEREAESASPATKAGEGEVVVAGTAWKSTARGQAQDDEVAGRD
jgi:transposase-like protein